MYTNPFARKRFTSEERFFPYSISVVRSLGVVSVYAYVYKCVRASIIILYNTRFDDFPIKEKSSLGLQSRCDCGGCSLCSICSYDEGLNKNKRTS